MRRCAALTPWCCASLLTCPAQQTVVSGKAWHSECYNKTKTEKPMVSPRSNAEACGICGKMVGAKDPVSGDVGETWLL